MSALIRLCDGEPDAELAALIDRALERMLQPVERGGARSDLDGGPFLEENPGTPVSHVLNGCLYGLFGLYDAADALGHQEAGRAAGEIETTLSRAVTTFTAPLGWTWYALRAHGRRYIARGYYHSVHIVQARVVAARTGDADIERAARLWASALDSLPTRLLYGAAKSAQVVWMRDIRRVPLRSAPW